MSIIALSKIIHIVSKITMQTEDKVFESMRLNKHHFVSSILVPWNQPCLNVSLLETKKGSRLQYVKRKYSVICLIGQSVYKIVPNITAEEELWTFNSFLSRPLFFG